MTESLLRILSAAAATLLGLGLWWGLLAVARSSGVELASEWSIPVWVGFGMIVISLNRILENLLVQSGHPAPAPAE